MESPAKPLAAVAWVATLAASLVAMVSWEATASAFIVTVLL